MINLYHSIRFVALLIVSIALSTALHLALEYAGFILTFMMFGKLCPEWISLLGSFYIPYAVAGILLGMTRGIRLPLLTAPCGAALAHATFHWLYGSWTNTLQDSNYLPMILVSALGSLLGLSLLRAYKKLLPESQEESSSAMVNTES